MEQEERRAVTTGGLVKTTIQLTPEQMRRLDERTGTFGSRADLIRRYVERGLDQDEKAERLVEAAAS